MISKIEFQSAYPLGLALIPKQARKDHSQTGEPIDQTDSSDLGQDDLDWQQNSPGVQLGENAAEYWADIVVNSDHPLAPLEHIPNETDGPITNVGRPDLGIIGNVIRAQLDDSLAKTNFEQYWLGRGDYDSSSTDFDNIFSVIGVDTPELGRVEFGGNDGYAIKYGFYDTKYDRLLGDAYIIYDKNGIPIGLRDDYDFNFKIWYGGRSFWPEVKVIFESPPIF